MDERKTNFTEEEIQQFHNLFNKFCKEEFDAGHCEEDSCEWCPVNKGYEEIFDTLCPEEY